MREAVHALTIHSYTTCRGPLGQQAGGIDGHVARHHKVVVVASALQLLWEEWGEGRFQRQQQPAEHLPWSSG
jgi:hypothetical protein